MSSETLRGQRRFIFAARVNRAAFLAEAKKYEQLALIKAAAEKRRRERPC